MRIGLIAMLRTGEDGALRGGLMLAGRSVLAWQAALLCSLGAERILCLVEDPAAVDVIALQHELEARGVAFHALKGFAAIPALVRAEDDLIVLLDGLIPDPAVARALLGGEGSPIRAVATLPSDHPLAVTRPDDFERIDAARHWGGILAMRGAPVQQLGEFPADADAIPVLLRLALQAGTPTQDLTARELIPQSWMLAESAAAIAVHEHSLIARAARAPDWRAPGLALAAVAARKAAEAGVGQGGVVAGGASLVLLLVGVMAAAFGFPATGLATAGLGVLSAEFARAMGSITARLRREETDAQSPAVLTGAADVLSGIVLWFALAPWPHWQPLAVLGPVVVALARLYGAGGEGALAAAARDRAGLLVVLALAAGLDWLPEVLACLALGLLAALLLRAGEE